MSALIDLWNDTKKLPPREKLIGVTRFFMGTQYLYGGKDAKPLDGVRGRRLDKKIDCSGVVRAIFDEVFPDQGLASRSDRDALKFQTEDLYEDVTEPK